MKRIISMALIVIMVMSLVACSGEGVGDYQGVSTAIDVEGEITSTEQIENESEGSMEDVSTEEITTEEIALEDLFVSDWKEGEKNAIGNTSWNLNSLNYVTEQGDWVYYFVNDELCKEDSEGNKYVLASQVRGKDIQIIGDWIYFYNLRENVISKIKTDGSEWITGYSCLKFFATEKGIVYVTTKQASASTYDLEITFCDLNFENNKILISGSKISNDWTPAVDFIGVFGGRLYLSCYGYYNKGYSTYSYGFKTLYYIDFENGKAIKLENVDVDRWVMKDANYVMVDNYIYLYITRTGSNGTVIRKLDAVNEKEIEIMSSSFPYRVYGIGKITNGSYGSVDSWVIATNEGIFQTDEFRTTCGLVGFSITEDVAYDIALTQNYIYYYVSPLVSGTGDFSKEALYRIGYYGDDWEYIGIYNSYGG
ncbi:MAG: hypothetical protein IJN46_02825 [Lachnospiraceae bacterium]|nr:hypothetical protein [Lachnospiraceae bacterium]